MGTKKQEYNEKATGERILDRMDELEKGFEAEKRHAVKYQNVADEALKKRDEHLARMQDMKSGYAALERLAKDMGLRPSLKGKKK
jgi:phage shock protein A